MAAVLLRQAGALPKDGTGTAKGGTGGLMLFVVGSAGQQWTIEVDPEATVGDVAAEVHKQGGPPASAVKLRFSGRDLAHSALLCDEGVGAQAQLELVTGVVYAQAWGKSSVSSGLEIDDVGLVFCPETGKDGNTVVLLAPPFTIGQGGSVNAQMCLRLDQAHSGGVNHAAGFLSDEVHIDTVTNTRPKQGILFGWRKDSYYAYQQNGERKSANQSLENHDHGGAHPMVQEGAVLKFRLLDGNFSVSVIHPAEHKELLMSSNTVDQLPEGQYHFAIYVYSAAAFSIVAGEDD
eukprot:TRINITY_DN4258_c0_g2_i3.p1 TRINITY_DN4258_c0_g2~~TRINITY_DN4258_c0_g2_i3.p1  ORF type:complete len:312 (+),score=66.35 TRINITY_DN4258_c0_g2_i3:65-937(+)